MQRRHCLLGALAIAGVGPVAAQHRHGPPQWDTGNSRLVPLSAHQGRVLFAGDETIGVLAPELGKIAWKRAHLLPSGASFRVRAHADALVSGCAERISAWQFQTGALRWAQNASIQFGVPCVASNQTLVCDGHVLKSFNTLDGRLQWQFAFTPETVGAYAPVVAGQSVWLAPGDGILYGLDRQTGTLLHRIDRSSEWQYLRQMQVDGAILVAGSYKELLYGLSASTGKVLWTFNAGNFINSQLVSDGRAYLWSPTGWIFAIDIREGKVLWRHQTTHYQAGKPAWGSLMAELVVVGQALFALDMDNVLHVLDTRNGQETARFNSPDALSPTVLPWGRDTVMLATESGMIKMVKIG